MEKTRTIPSITMACFSVKDASVVRTGHGMLSGVEGTCPHIIYTTVERDWLPWKPIQHQMQMAP